MKKTLFRKYNIKINYDKRGWFKEAFNKNFFNEKFGTISIKQSNITLSLRKNTIRGFHYQKSKYGQTKILQLISGSIDDYAICIDKKSSNYLKLKKIELNSLDELIVIPRDYAHCIVTKKDKTILNYYVDNYYNPDYEVTLNPIKIFNLNNIYFKKKYFLSEKDIKGIELNEI